MGCAGGIHVKENEQVEYSDCIQAEDILFLRDPMRRLTHCLPQPTTEPGLKEHEKHAERMRKFLQEVRLRPQELTMKVRSKQWAHFQADAPATPFATQRVGGLEPVMTVVL
mmetsp:Transcript_125597/g.298232  ORF Transcript_125597/g.298232 Transcript_125597/m.298232 type:complete len:111 (-) Transcript_125597:100-432(-)